MRHDISRPGYTNAGSTCYLSAAMHLLGAIVAACRCTVPRAVDELLKPGLHSGGRVVAVYDALIERAKCRGQTHAGMGDDYEALLNLLENMRAIGLPEPYTVTQGTITSHFTCLQDPVRRHTACGAKRDPFNALDLYVEGLKSASVQELLMGYFGGKAHRPEKIEVNCEACSRVACDVCKRDTREGYRPGLYSCERCDAKGPGLQSKRLKLPLPKVMVLHVARGQKRGRSAVHVAVPTAFHLNLTDGVDHIKRHRLDLLCAALHKGGSVDSGHYTAFRRHRGEWYEFDDNIATPHDPKAFLREHGAQVTTLVYLRHEGEAVVPGAASAAATTPP